MKLGACVGVEFRKMIKNHDSIYSPGDLLRVFNSIRFAFEPEVCKWMQQNLGRMSTKISDFLKYRLEGGDEDHVAIKLQLLTVVDVDAGDFESFGHYASSAK